MSKKLYEQKAVLYKAKMFDPLFQVKAVDDAKGIIQAYASKFGNEDEYKDIVVEGAYKRTLANQKKANRPYLYTYLYQHDPSLIVGGIKEAEEDRLGLLYQAQCNLDTQLGRETYSNAKMGVLYQSSIGYDVPEGGAEYKEGIRYLKEIRLWEISLVTFAANPEATVVDVKSSQRPYEIWTPEAEYKTICGNTSGAIGPRDEAWDGLKGKVETLYNRINKKYPNDPELTPKWKDDGKSGERSMQRKTLMEHYNEEMACDLLKDLQDVYVCSLVKAIFDAFTIGDQPEQDISQALDDFKTLMLDEFVAQGIKVGLSEYLESNAYSYTPGLNQMLNGSDSSNGYGYMSRSDRMDQKAGRSISAATQSVIDDHVKAVKAMAKKAKTDMQAHTDAMHDAVDSMSGNGKSLGTLAAKAGRSLSADNADRLHDMADKAMDIVGEHTKALHKAANGLANAVKPPVSDTDGEDPKDDEDQQVEKSLQDALKELKALAV